MYVVLGNDRHARIKSGEEYGRLANAVLDSFVEYIKVLGEYRIVHRIDKTSEYEQQPIDQREYYALPSKEDYVHGIKAAWSDYQRAFYNLQQWFRKHNLTEIRFNESELAYALTNRERWDYYHSSVLDCIRQGKIRTFARIETKFLEIYHFSGPPEMLRFSIARFGEYDEFDMAGNPVDPNKPEDD